MVNKNILKLLFGQILKGTLSVDDIKDETYKNEVIKVLSQKQ